MKRTTVGKPPFFFGIPRGIPVTEKHLLTLPLFLASGYACAVGIGDATLFSRMGEPLRVRVEILADKKEHLDNNCFSLLKPNADEDSVSFVTRARLTYKQDAERKFVEIRTSERFNDPFAMLRLQVKCPAAEAGAISKTITLLPDLPSSNDLAQNSDFSIPERIEEESPPVTAAEKSITNDSPPPARQTVAIAPPTVPAKTPESSTTAAPLAASKIAPDNSLPKKVDATPQLATQLHTETVRQPAPNKAANLNSEQTKKPSRKARKNASANTPFVLKLSGNLLDESRIGKNSQRLREQQRDMDADDQTASYLKLLHQVKLLQDELESVKLQLAELKTAPDHAAILPASAPSIAAAQTEIAPVLEVTPRSEPIPPVAASAPPKTSIGMNEVGYFAAEFLLAALTMLMGMRLYNWNKSRIFEKEAEPETELSPLHISQPPKQEKPTSVPSPAEEKPFDAGGTIRTKAFAQPVASSPLGYVPEPKPEISEADLLLEEAELYNIHGHPERAINILDEIIQKYPDKIEARMLLLTIFADSGKQAEFERASPSLMMLNPDEVTMDTYRSLQRTLTRNLPQNAKARAAEPEPEKPIEPLDLEFELPGEKTPVTTIDFELPTEKFSMSNLNFEIPEAESESARKPNPEHEATVDLEALMKELK